MGEAGVTVTSPTGLDTFNTLSREECEAALLLCCSSPRWAAAMQRMRPFHTEAALLDAAADVWRALSHADWLRSFAAHPKIGERGPVSRWSSQEQASVATADDDVLEELAAVNPEYEARFGYVFLICATGRTAEEILAELKRRIENPPATELQEAAAEQERITAIRLGKLLAELGATA
jgi:OHCU decarboxylase